MTSELPFGWPARLMVGTLWPASRNLTFCSDLVKSPLPTLQDSLWLRAMGHSSTHDLVLELIHFRDLTCSDTFCASLSFTLNTLDVTSELNYMCSIVTLLAVRQVVI